MIIKSALPDFDERDTQIDMLVLHCTAEPAKQALQTLRRLKLSAHYIIDLNGDIYCCVPEEKRAFHAGAGFWRGSDTSLNSRSVGIEICSPSLGQKPYPDNQIRQLIALCRTIIDKHGIPAYNIVGHSDIAPLRKPDPGLSFPWQQLSRADIGLWYTHQTLDQADVPALLAIIGYDTRTPEAIKASAYAFCRRFAPQFVIPITDVSQLVDNFLPEDYSFMQDPIFIGRLQAVAYTYQKQNPLI